MLIRMQVERRKHGHNVVMKLFRRSIAAQP